MLDLGEGILSEFEHASSLGRGTSGLDLRGDSAARGGYAVRFLLGDVREEEDLAEQFLRGDEALREEMRRQPRIIPKSAAIENKPEFGPAWNRPIHMADAIAIRRMLADGLGVREVGRRFKIPHATVQRIRDFKTFRPDRKQVAPCERKKA